jgi:Flp pilus assembly protein TadG
MTARRTRAGSRAQALVEFALVLPVLLLIVFGLIDGGRLVFTYNTVSNAARSGARVAIVNQSTSGTSTCDTTSATAWATGCAVQAGAAIGTQSADVQVAYRDASDTGPCSQLSIGCLAVVTVTGHYQAITPIIGQIVGPVAITSTSTIPIERVCSNPPPSPLTSC